MASDRHTQRDDADFGDDDDLREEELDELSGQTEPANPLGQAFPDVEEALRAEAGPDDAPTGRRTRSERAAAAREARQAREAGNEPEHEHAHEQRHRKGLFGRAADFLRASWGELKRVQWPDRRQVGQGTAVVLGFVVVAGCYLGLLDAIWSPLVQKIL